MWVGLPAAPILALGWFAIVGGWVGSAVVLWGEKPERPAYAPYVIAARVIFLALLGIYTGAMVAGSPGFPAPGSV